MRKSSEIIDDHINTLEEMIDIMDDLWEAEKQGKWRSAEAAKLQLRNAKKMYKDYLDEYIDRRIDTWANKNGVRRVIYTEDFDLNKAVDY